MFCSGQRRQRAVGVLLVRHEDEVPELEEARRSAGRRARSRARRSRAPRPSRSRSRSPGRTGRARRPTRSSRPSAAGTIRSGGMPTCCQSSIATSSGPSLQLRIARVHRDPDAVPVEPHVLQDELRRELDRTLLEVLPEREVAEHLEERQVVAVEPDLVDVRRCGSTFCEVVSERRRRRLEPEEVRHLRLHAGAS